MRPALVRRLVVAVALLGVAAGAPGALEGQQASEAELRESQRRLEAVRREREELRNEMSRIRGRVHDLSSELGNLEGQVGASAAALDELEYQVVEREVQIEQARQDLLVTREVLSQRRDVLHRRLRDIYKRGPLHTVRVLLGAESFSDLIHRYKYLLLIARHDRMLVEEVRGLERTLGTRERELRSTLLELATVRDVRSQEHGELTALERERQRALAAARAREQSTAQRIEELAEDERRLGAMIAALDRRRRDTESRAPTGVDAGQPASVSPRDLGTLPWPVDGSLVYRFGRVPQADGGGIQRTGIGIRAPAGTPVRSVAPGVVVLAGPFEGYGSTVVLSHGGGYYSLYLHLREVAVREGSRVERSQVVGTVGGQTTPEGPHVEFQIRAPGGQAVDPLPWLQSRGR